MADNYKAILEELCRTAFNFPAGELQELVGKPDADLTADDVTNISTKVKTRYSDTITSINKTNNLKLDEKFKAGQRTKAEEIEKLLKEKFEVESDKTGSDLVDELVVEVAKSVSKKTGEKVTDDDIRKHPYYLKKEQEWKQTVKVEKEAAEKKVNELTTAHAREKIFDKVAKQALTFFEGMNPILSENPKIAQAQKESFVDKFRNLEFQEVEGKLIPMKEGKVMTDEFNNTIEFDKLIKSVAEGNYDFKKAKERQSPTTTLKPGDPGYKEQQQQQQQQQQQSYTGALPNSESEWSKMMNDPKLSIADKKTINEHWTKQTEKAE